LDEAVTQVGDVIHVRGRAERVTEVEMIFRDGQPFYVALRTERIEEPRESEMPA
jgi:hypothetical protein